MSNRWWNPFDGMEQTAFKPVPGGYVYRAPNPWVLGPGRHYLVNEAQKTELAACHRSMMQQMFWSIIAGTMIAMPFAIRFFAEHSGMTLAVSALGGLAIGIAISVRLVRKVRPIIAGLTPTTCRITQGDAFKSHALALSPRTAIGFAALDCALLVLVVANAVFGRNGWDLFAVVGTLLSGFGAAYFVALAVAQRKRAEV